MSEPLLKLSKKDAIKQLWHKGILAFKLDRNQKELYDLFYSADYKVHTWMLARRNGKTYALLVLALEQCLRKPNSIVKFLAPTKLQVNTIIRPIIRELLEDCPEEIKPQLREKDYVYYFPNGSEIQLAGSDNGHCEKLRGGNSDISIIDEAGSCSDLDYVVKSILLPTTLMTKGKVILAGTPPEDADHDFLKFIEKAEDRGSLIKKTIYDNPRLTKEMIDEMIEELGGIDSSAFKRECLCQIIRDEKSSVLPEFTDELVKSIVKDHPRPPHYDSYESMDWGGKDLTVTLFGYFDFRANKVVIEDELIFERKDLNLIKVAEAIVNKEKELWYNIYTNEVKEPLLRVSDINYIAVDDLRRHSNGRLNFVHVKKDDKESAVNVLRVMLAQEKIIIHPRCKTLLRHMKTARWKKSTTINVFARSETEGHYDAVDALIYFVRNIAYTKNPYPAGYGMDMSAMFVKNPDRFYNQEQNNVYRKIFGIKRK